MEGIKGEILNEASVSALHLFASDTISNALKPLQVTANIRAINIQITEHTPLYGIFLKELRLDWQCDREHVVSFK